MNFFRVTRAGQKVISLPVKFFFFFLIGENVFLFCQKVIEFLPFFYWAVL